MNWIEALREFNKNRPTYLIPKRGSKEHSDVLKIMNEGKKSKKSKKNIFYEMGNVYDSLTDDEKDKVYKWLLSHKKKLVSFGLIQ